MASIQTVDGGSANGRKKVRDYILTRFKKGEKLPKVIELSKKLYTSKYAAERAMTELSAEGRIKRKPRFGSVLVDQNEGAATANPLKDARSVAFMADELDSFLSTEIMRGVDSCCREQKFSLSLLNSNYSVKTEEELITNLANNHVSGAVVRISEHMENAKILDEKVPQDFPLVLVDHSDLDHCFVCVRLDNEKAGDDATKHLVDLGHQRIAHITYSKEARRSLEGIENRKRGYEKALREADIEVPPEYVQNGTIFEISERPTDSYFRNVGYAPMNRLLLQKERPTAVFLVNFFFVFGVLKAIEDHGLRVPEDISVICIDDEPVSAHLNPPITVYAQPLREIGAKAARLLVDMIAGKKPKEKCYKLQGRLVPRSSTGPVKSK